MNTNCLEAFLNWTTLQQALESKTKEYDGI